MSKLDKDTQAWLSSGVPAQVPNHSRFLRITARASHGCKGVEGDVSALPDSLCFGSAFGLPWDCESFMKRACEVGHPHLQDSGVPVELAASIDKHLEWNELQLSRYRRDWCKHWLVRAKQLDEEEARLRGLRDSHVQAATRGKRILLTAEILKSIGYEDIAALDLLTDGATLAGDIPYSPAFKSQYKPCMSTMRQLENEAQKQSSSSCHDNFFRRRGNRRAPDSADSDRA